VAALPGKYARFNSPSGSPVGGPFRWNIGFRRERLDTTNFESAVDAAGVNVFSEGATGVLDTTVQMEMYNSDVSVAGNFFFPGLTLTGDLLFRKPGLAQFGGTAHGYIGLILDVLDFSPSTAVREVSKSTIQLQSNGFVPLAV
jgi:hypothetical protein